MKQFVCDNCGSGNSLAKVKLKGIAKTRGDILLPSELHRKHFCSEECFWIWIRDNLPRTVTLPK